VVVDVELIETIPVGNILGEGVLWNPDTQCLWWTDIQERRLFCRRWGEERWTSFALPERLGSFGFVAGSTRLIAAFETGVALYDPHDGALEWLSRPLGDGSGIRFNDGRVDRRGRFWTGTMAERDDREGQAELYCVDASGHIHVRESGITISNGICWSPDGARFYFSDSPKRAMYVYDCDAASGEISNRQTFARTPEGAFPDGANVDADGCIWSAQWGAGRVVRYKADGAVERVLEMPVSQPSCVAFGGPNLDLLFVTSARDGLNEQALLLQPRAGDIFVYRVGIAGLAEKPFAFDPKSPGKANTAAGRDDAKPARRPEPDL
jgi:L-arabinonolactonase